MSKYIKVSDLKQNELIFPSFLNPVQEKEIEKLSIDAMPQSEIKGGFLIIKGDEVNSFLVAALRSLNMEQKIVLRDNLIARTPKEDKPIDKVSAGWIDVKDSLPENTDNVLVFANKIGEQIDVAFYNDTEKEWQGLNDFWINNITHWMLLPEKP